MCSLLAELASASPQLGQVVPTAPRYSPPALDLISRSLTSPSVVEMVLGTLGTSHSTLHIVGVAYMFDKSNLF